MEKPELLSDIYKLQLKKAALDSAVENHKANTLKISEVGSNLIDIQHTFQSLSKQVDDIKNEIVGKQSILDSINNEILENKSVLSEIRDFRSQITSIKKDIFQLETVKNDVNNQIKVSNKLLVDSTQKHQDFLESADRDSQTIKAKQIDESLKHEKHIDALKIKEQELVNSIANKQK